MINGNEIRNETEKNNEKRDKNEREFYLNDLEEKYKYLIKNNSDKNHNKKINLLKNILENSFAINKFDNYINSDFLDNSEYKLVFMPDEFKMREENKFYFTGFGEKKRKRVNYRNRNNNRNYSKTEAKKKQKKFE